jgi:hypothetical protein
VLETSNENAERILGDSERADERIDDLHHTESQNSTLQIDLGATSIAAATDTATTLSASSAATVPTYFSAPATTSATACSATAPTTLFGTSANANDPVFSRLDTNLERLPSHDQTTATPKVLTYRQAKRQSQTKRKSK